MKYKEYFKKAVENPTIAITITTATVTLLISIIRIIAYSYWKSYVTHFGIDADKVYIVNENIVFEAIFYGVIYMSIIYVLKRLYNNFVGITEIIANDNTFKDKMFTISTLYVGNVLLSIGLTAPINYCLLLIFNIETLPSFKMIISAVMICMYEILIMSIMALFSYVRLRIEKDTINKDEKIENRTTLDVDIIMFIIVCLITITLATYFGFTKARDKKTFDLVDNNKYAIIYKSNDKYIALKCEIEGNNIIIQKNKQKVIEDKNYIYETIGFSQVIVK